MLFALLYFAPAHSELSALQAHSRACITCDLAILHVKMRSLLGSCVHDFRPGQGLLSAGHYPAVVHLTYLLQASHAAVFAGLRASDYNSLALQVMVTHEM